MSRTGWQQVMKKCIEEYEIITELSRIRGPDCEMGAVYDCEDCWSSDVISEENNDG